MGIIPARAGFTMPYGTNGLGSQDHPRSRGVYYMRSDGLVHGQGSSPLARGLPGAMPVTVPAARIIPARAGFTDPLADGRAHTTDHPRSRGVYFMLRWRTRMVVGSSPLARGLPGHVSGEGDCNRIIPARAGFTPT